MSLSFVRKLFANYLIECAERELHEETGLSVTIPDTTPVLLLLLRLSPISYLETVYLGINISNEQLKRIRPTWEGGVVEIPFDELKDKLCYFDDWTPSGLLHILFWLALDTPNSKEKLKFAGEDAATLFEEVVKRVEQYEIEKFDKENETGEHL
jgi:8-oxo-dGTP pyrophosphatase MutT (NUDIX family)